MSKPETIEEAVKSGNQWRVYAALARFERAGRRRDHLILACWWAVLWAAWGLVSWLTK